MQATMKPEREGAIMSYSDDVNEATIDELNEEADIAADYIEGLLDILDYEGDIEMGIRNGRPLINLVADDNSDIKHLVGEHGEVIEALQCLARLAIQEKTEERSRLILDIDGYLAKRRDSLQAVALEAAAEARRTGSPVVLRDMNSYERKIIHDAVRDEGLRSRSHGEEPHRRVTIYPPKNDDLYEEETTTKDNFFYDDDEIVVLPNDQNRDIDTDEDLTDDDMYSDVYYDDDSEEE